MTATSTGPSSDDRERYGRIFHEQGRLTVNAEREKPFAVDPWEGRTGEMREIDMRGASAVAIQAIADAGLRLEELTRLAMKLSGARGIVGNFLKHYGHSELPMFKPAIDLAHSVRKILEDDGEADPETPLSDALHTLGEVRHMAESMAMSDREVERECGGRILAALGTEPETSSDEKEAGA